MCRGWTQPKEPQSQETEKDGTWEILSAWIQLCLKLTLGFLSLTTHTFLNHLHCLIQSPWVIAPDLKHKLELQARFLPLLPLHSAGHTHSCADSGKSSST